MNNLQARLEEVAENDVASKFNELELISKEKIAAANYILYEDDETPISIIEKIKNNEIAFEPKLEVKNSYFYLKKLIVTLLLIDYEVIAENENIKENFKNYD